MPLIQTKPKGETLLNAHMFYVNKEELSVAKAPPEHYVDSLKDYLDSGHDLLAPVHISYSFSVEGYGISTTLPNHENICSFSAKASFMHHVITTLANYEITDVAFLKDYDLNWNTYFEFTGSYNNGRPLDGTPLHFLAFYAEDASLAESLIELGAQPNITNSMGLTAAQEAEFFGNSLLADYLNGLIETHPEYQEPITYAEFLEQQIKLEPESPSITTDDLFEQNTQIEGLDTIETPVSTIETPASIGIIDSVVDYFYSAWQLAMSPIIDTSSDTGL